MNSELILRLLMGFITIPIVIVLGYVSWSANREWIRLNKHIRDELFNKK